MARRLHTRTQQVLDLIYRRGQVSAADIQAELPFDLSYSAVRSILRQLERKGLVRHREQGLRYVYQATIPKRRASRSAVAELIDTFFDGSPEHAMQSLLDVSRDAGYDVDYDALADMIAEARREGR